jgi:hypothetical protein
VTEGTAPRTKSLDAESYAEGWFDALAASPGPAATPDLRAALEGLDEPLRWLLKHYRKAFVEMPTPLYRRFEKARAALAAPAATAGLDPDRLFEALIAARAKPLFTREWAVEVAAEYARLSSAPEVGEGTVEGEGL